MTKPTLPDGAARLLRAAGDWVAPSGIGKGRFCIVNYHRILAAPDPLLETEPDLDTFRWQMETLSTCFNVLPLNQAIGMVGSARMPPRAVCITFDDGYRSVHNLALPILKQLGLPATVFVTSGYVSGGNMWNDRIIEVVQNLPAAQLDLREYGLGIYSLLSVSDRTRTVLELTEASKYLPPQVRLALTKRLEQMLGEHPEFDSMLTPEMVVNLDRAGIEIGAHTISHPILTSLSDEGARQEIEGSKNELEAIIGKPVRLFAYPNGKVGKDFDERHTRMAREAGFDAAFTTSIGAVTGRHDRFRLPRSRPWDKTPFMFGLRLLRWLARDEREVPEQGARQDAAPATAGDSGASLPRVLMTAFHFPPQAASSGIQRTLSFSRHLGAHGWEPMVLSAAARAYSVQNPSQLASVPPALIVRRAFALDTKRHLGIQGRYPESLALPDRWVSWWFGAVPAGLRLIRQHRPQVIWSTFPISTAHLIGLALHRLTGLPWVADFRDPMLQSSYPSSPLQRKVYGWIERQTMERCSAAVFTSHSALDTYRRRFPALPPEKFTLIENGYDEDSFPADLVVPPRSDRRLTLIHSGVLYPTGRNPTAFLQALSELKRSGAVSAGQLRVILRAPGEGQPIAAAARALDVDDIVEVAPPIPYRDALAEMLSADALMVFQGTPFNTQVPAKIYEYFRARKPILGLVDLAGETARLLRLAGFGASLAEMDDAAAMAPLIVTFVGQLRTGQAHIATDELVASSSRTHRASQLADLLRQVVDGHHRTFKRVP